MISPARRRRGRGAAPALRAGPAPRAALAPRSGGGVQESPISFDGVAADCFGIVSARRGGAAGGASGGLAAVWLNAGALHHIGPNRAWVEVARRWAARGIPSVRIDLPDLGEAGGEPPRVRSDASFYTAQRIVQTRAIVDQLAAQGVGERFILGGLCSGAYWALHAALADPRVCATMLINLYAIVYDEALVIERETAQSLDALGSRAWRKLLRGQLSAAQIRGGLASISPARVRRGASHPVARGQRVRNRGRAGPPARSGHRGRRPALARGGSLRPTGSARASCPAARRGGPT